jgi:hypothetical protein
VFARDFGFTIAARVPQALHLRGSLPGTPCVVIRKGARTRFVGPTFKAADAADLHTLASETNRRVEALTGPAEGTIVRLHDPSGFAVGFQAVGFQYVPGQRERGPALAFIRCDRGAVPADHHTVALHLGPTAAYSHSAYQVTDLDAVAAGGEYLLRRGYERAWGIGRHVLGSQIFDYWRDPDNLTVEHFTDGDLFDNAVEPGWAPLTTSGLSQWGPRASQKFPGAEASPRLLRDVITALRDDNEINLPRLAGMAKGLGR